MRKEITEIGINASNPENEWESKPVLIIQSFGDRDNLDVNLIAYFDPCALGKG